MLKDQADNTPLFAAQTIALAARCVAVGLIAIPFIDHWVQRKTNWLILLGAFLITIAIAAIATALGKAYARTDRPK